MTYSVLKVPLNLNQPTNHLGPCNSVGTRPRTDTQTDSHRWPQYISRHLWLTRNV